MHAKNSTLQTSRRTRHGPSIESRSLFGLVTRPILFGRLLLSVSCSHTPAPQAVCECASQPALPPQVDAGTPAMDALALQRGPGEAEPSAAARALDGGSSSSRPRRRAPTFNAPASWHCLKWTQLMEGVPFSTDCYATTEECQAARPDPERSLHGSGCWSAQRAWCTEIYGQADALARCFGNIKSCEKARSYAADDGLESSECSEVSGKR